MARYFLHLPEIDSYYRSLDAKEAGRQNIDITMLPTGINIIAVVEADFDLGDKPQANNKNRKRDWKNQSLHSADQSSWFCLCGYYDSQCHGVFCRYYICDRSGKDAGRSAGTDEPGKSSH